MRRARTIGRHDGEYPRTYQELFEGVGDPGSVAWRLRMEPPLYGENHSGHRVPVESAAGYIGRFTDLVRPAEVRALVVGQFPDEDFQMRAEEVAGALSEIAPRLANLRSLFFAEILQEESDISWIQLCDLAPLLKALPRLRRFTVRGSGELSLHVPEHRGLRELTVQSGGLPGRLSREIASSGLPALEHLELWLGVEDYGGDTVPADLAPLLSGAAFPQLRHLGLRNAEGIDAWVPVLAEAPVLERLEVLDLSLGDLTDEGAQALVDHAGAFSHLKRLDLHHHYLSEEAREGVRAALPGVEVDLSDPHEPEEYDGELHRYTAVSE
nr:STM4015 family protein [Nocardiopsis algeriensis]